MNYHENVLSLIGHTPLVKLARLTKGVKATVLAKMENLNPGFSVKDRIGISMIEAAEREGILKPGGTIVEATSGNTGIGLALAAAVKGYKCIFVMTDKASVEKSRYLKALGADVVITPVSAKPARPQQSARSPKVDRSVVVFVAAARSAVAPTATAGRFRSRRSIRRSCSVPPGRSNATARSSPIRTSLSSSGCR